MMHFKGCSSPSILVENCVKNAKFEGNTRGKMCLVSGALPLDPALYCDREHTLGTAPGPRKGRCSLTPLVAAAPRPPPSNLKTKEELGGENVQIKGDILIPSLPNECIFSDLDLPLSEVCKNSIPMFEHQQIIDEFLEQCDFDDENLTTYCSLCYRKEDQCICLNNQKQMVNEVQDFYDPYHDKDESEQFFLIPSTPCQIPTQEDQGMHYVGDIYYYSNSLQSQHISSKCTSPPCTHNECNHAYSQQPPYPSLSSLFHPSYLLPSTLSPSHFLPYSLCHSHHILPTPPYPPKATMLSHIPLHNKVVNSTYKLS